MSCRGALDLLSIYNDDECSEDETVLGAKISTKRLHESEINEEHYSKCKKQFRLPMPEQFAEDKQVALQNETDHQGKVRSFPHERGNWATFLYLPFCNDSGIHEIINVISQRAEMQLYKVDNFHISLTKTLVLKYHWIDSFISTISHQVKGFNRFIIMFDAIEVYCNEERTRTFIGLKIRTGYDSLIKLTLEIDECLKEYRLETYYKHPSYHMSILWCLGDKMSELQALLPQFNVDFCNLLSASDPDTFYIHVSALQCKTGNKLFTLSF